MPSSKGSQASEQNAKSFTSVGSDKSSTHAARSLYNQQAKNKNQFMPKYVAPCNEVRQRVLSAKALRNKAFHNQLKEAEQVIAKLKQENHMLHTIHQRQDAALSKYESASADLPSLLNAHVEELNGWDIKHRKLQNTAKDIEDKIKHQESIIFNLNEDIKRYGQLNKNKSLDTKENLLEKIDGLQTQIRDRSKEDEESIEYLQNEIKCKKQRIDKARAKSNEIAIKLKQMELDLKGIKKLDVMDLEKAEISEQTNEDTDVSTNESAFEEKKLPGVSESIPTRIPCKKARSINTSFIKNIKPKAPRITKPISESEEESKVKTKSTVIRKSSAASGDEIIFIKPRPILRRKMNIQQGAGDGPTNARTSQLRTKVNKERGDGDGPTKHKSFLLSSKNRAAKQLTKSNKAENPTKKVIFCEESQKLGELSNFGDTDGNESVNETVESHTAHRSITSENTADTGNMADDDREDNDDMPKSIMSPDDDLKMHCMGKIMSGLRVQMSTDYTSHHNQYVDSFSELEQSN